MLYTEKMVECSGGVGSGTIPNVLPQKMTK